MAQQLEGGDVFMTSTDPQPSQQVSFYYINFTIYCLTDIIQGAFHPSPTESHDPQVGLGLDGSPAGHTSGPETPSHWRQRQPSPQVSNFIIYCLTDLIQGAFHPTQTESFNLQISPGLDDSPEGYTSGPATPTRRQRRVQKQAPKAGSRVADRDDDVFFLFDELGEHRYCSLCK
jgi:hypothetical protein